ncbi:MAG: hypothetical protein ABIR11_11465 [Candidatus Limnocylindrales bacterium]
MTFARLWIVIALALPALVALLVPMPAVDLAYQVRTGELILATGRLPGVDTFTFTVGGQPWTDQQWLAQVVLALGQRVGGWELLAVLRAVMVMAIVALMAATSIARGTGPRTAAVLALVGFALMAPALALRPQLFGILLFAAITWLVVTRADHPRRVWVAPLLVVLWANVHGSFVLAPAILAYGLLDDVIRGRPWRRSLGILVAGILATAITPFGPGVWAYAAGIGANPVIANQVSEWQRTSPLIVTGALFYASVIGTGLLLVRGRRALSLADAGLYLGLVAIGAWTVRGIAWWPIGAVLLVATVLPGLAAAAGVVSKPDRPIARGPARMNAAVAMVLGLAIVAALPWWRAPDPLIGRIGLLAYAPSGLAQALRERTQPGTRVAAPQAWTSWFEWAVPDALYLVDARFELFPADVWADYARIAAGGSTATEPLARWQVDLVVVPADGTAPDGWTRIYADGDGGIYGRGSN